MSLSLRIEKLIWQGQGLARKPDGQVVIIDPPVFPGEEVEVEIYKEYKDYLKAQVKKIVKPHPKRRTHPCPVADKCGGCKFGYVPASYGLKLKKDIFTDTIQRSYLKNIDFKPKITIIPSPKNWRYRHRGQVFVQTHQPGFKQMASSKFVPVEDCLLFVSVLGKSLHQLATKKKTGRYTVISNGRQIAIEGEDKLLKFGLNNFPLTYFFSANHFFQANWKLNQVLIDLVCKLSAKYTRIADLYAGAGNFSLPLAWMGKQVLALEGNPDAVRLGQNLAHKNELDLIIRRVNLNTTQPSLFKFSPQSIIVDPPRSGAPSLAKTLLNLPELEQVIWISCELSKTLRDLRPLLKKGFQITQIYILDMFPQTWHLETLLLLEKNT